MNDTLADRIDALLPQTQCRQCGYAGCRPYAEAIAAGRAGINRCPPGGEDTVRELSRLTGMPFEPLDPACGATMPPAVAIIDEEACIGCTLCLQACPVDAIVGAAKLMHTVIAAECTGCKLCIPPCPVDCITMIETGHELTRDERQKTAQRARRRFDARTERLKREREERALRLAAAKKEDAQDTKRATLQKAIARARQRLQQRG